MTATSDAGPRRRASPRGDADDELEERLRRLRERTDPFLTWLGLVFAVLVAAQFSVPATSTSGRVLTVVSWVIWAVFAVDFAVQLWLAPRKRTFLRRNWLSLLGLLLPTLRFFSFLRLLRLGRALPVARALTSTTRAARTSGRVFRGRLGYLLGLASIATLVVAELGYLSESGPGGTLPTFGAALLWAAACVIGQSPSVTPVTLWGQLTMLAAFAVGLTVIATLAGSVGAYLLQPAGERRAESAGPDGSD